MSQPIHIDIIMLSFAKNEELRQVTELALSSLAASEPSDHVQFHTIVIESNRDAPAYSAPGVKTVFLDETFNYHRFMNHGIALTASDYVAICNNDLFFHPNWASKILQAFQADPTLQSTSPACGLHHPKAGYALNSGDYAGYKVRGEIAGWCLVFRRSMLAITGPLDERFYFWYADNDYAKTLEKHGLKHALLTASRVDHLESQTLDQQDSTQKIILTRKAKYIYQRKWEGKGRWFTMRKIVQLYIKLYVRNMSHTLHGNKAR